MCGAIIDMTNAGWDVDLVVSDREQPTIEQLTPAQKWLEDVIEPAKRSDRMSWMLLGCSISLAHELDVFRDDDKLTGIKSQIEIMRSRRLRARKLLYIYTNQLASRLGCTSIYPQNIGSSLVGSYTPTDTVRWDAFMNSWTELTKLSKSWSDLVFPSPTATKQLLHSGRYVSLLEHYAPLLEEWRRKNLDPKGISRVLHKSLSPSIDYV